MSETLNNHSESMENDLNNFQSLTELMDPEEMNSLFGQLEDRFGIENSPENREKLSQLFGAESRRQELLASAENLTSDYDKWNTLTDAENTRRRSALLIYDLIPGTYEEGADYDDQMLKVERIRRQILASPEVKALEEGNANTGYRIDNIHHEFVEPTKEDVSILTFDEYKNSHNG